MPVRHTKKWFGLILDCFSPTKGNTYNQRWEKFTQRENPPFEQNEIYYLAFGPSFITEKNNEYYILFSSNLDFAYRKINKK